eukprot:7985199-Pyramimonas_sp.AAC.1
MYGVRFTERTYEHTADTHQRQWYARTYQAKNKELYLRTLEFARDFWNVVVETCPALAERHK